MTPGQPETKGNAASPETGEAAPPAMGYEARYGGWNRRNRRLVLIALLFCAAAFLVAMPAWLRVADLVLFGGGTLLMLAASMSRPVALRVDAAGITLCRSPLYRRTATCIYPWPEVEQVVVWRAFRMDYVGVLQGPGARPPTGRFTGPVSRRAAALTSGLPPGVAVTGVAASNWVLDRERLAAAVARLAPHVRVADLTAPGA